MVAQLVKNLSARQETRVLFLGWEVPLEKGMAIHSSILAWRIPRTEKPGGLQSMRLQSWTRLSYWVTVSPQSTLHRCDSSVAHVVSVQVPDPGRPKASALSPVVGHFGVACPILNHFIGWSTAPRRRKTSEITSQQLRTKVRPLTMEVNSSLHRAADSSVSCIVRKRAQELQFRGSDIFEREFALAVPEMLCSSVLQGKMRSPLIEKALNQSVAQTAYPRRPQFSNQQPESHWGNCP